MPGLTDWFDVFRCGTHRDHSGTLRTIGADDIDKAIRNYRTDTAPVVIGHPTLNAPAFGWVGSFRRVGDVVQARCSRVAAEFADLVQRGLYKNRSISFNADGTFRHVGFLGAVPPAVKGLEDISFNDKGDFVTMDLNTATPADAPEAVAGPEMAGEAVQAESPQAEAEPAKVDSPQADVPKADAPKADESLQSLIAQYKSQAEAGAARLKEMEARLKDMEERLNDERAKAQKAEFASYADGLVFSGRLKADCKDQLVGVLTDLVDHRAGADFAEADNGRLERIKDLLNKALPASSRVEFAEVATAPMAEPPHDPQAIARQIRDYRAEQAEKGLTVSASQAMNHILGGK